MRLRLRLTVNYDLDLLYLYYNPQFDFQRYAREALYCYEKKEFFYVFIPPWDPKVADMDLSTKQISITVCDSHVERMMNCVPEGRVNQFVKVILRQFIYRLPVVLINGEEVLNDGFPPGVQIRFYMKNDGSKIVRSGLSKKRSSTSAYIKPTTKNERSSKKTLVEPMDKLSDSVMKQPIASEHEIPVEHKISENTVDKEAANQEDRENTLLKSDDSEETQKKALANFMAGLW